MRAALLDDDVDLLDTITFLLAHRGIDVSPFSSSADFRTAHALAPYDVLVADVSLGTDNGYDVARAFLTERPGRKAFVLTGSLDPPPGDLAITVLRKPLDLDALFEALTVLARQT